MSGLQSRDITQRRIALFGAPGKISLQTLSGRLKSFELGARRIQVLPDVVSTGRGFFFRGYDQRAIRRVLGPLFFCTVLLVPGARLELARYF